MKKKKKTPADIVIKHKCTINDNYMMYGSWDMKRDRQNFFFILGHFFPFYPTNNPKNQNREKMKKTPGDIIILHLRTRNDDHMLYCSWDIAHNKIKFLFFTLGYFFPFYPPNRPKYQNFHKMKKMPGAFIILHRCTKNNDHMMYSTWDMVGNGQMDRWTNRWTNGQVDEQMDI